jgi:hypothetical protein
MTEITELLATLLNREQLAALRRREATPCWCGGMPPVNESGDIGVCDHCDGSGTRYKTIRYYVVCEETSSLPRATIEGVGEVAYDTDD